MCWTIEVSLGSAAVGWATCAYLWRRNRSPRDRWYACYLLTYTFTQLVDIALWTLHDATDGGLRGCDEFKLQLTDGPSGEARTQYALSKYVVPLVTLSQFATMLQYPSERLREHRSKLVAFHALACLGMALQFACTDTVTSRWPTEHTTLRWGGHSAETWQVLCVVALQCADFHLLMPERSVRNAHIGTFLSVVGFLWATEGTLALGSKWCTYCLIFSATYATEPVWGPPAGKPEAVQKEKAEKAPKKKRRSAARSPSPNPTQLRRPVRASRRAPTKFDPADSTSTTYYIS